MERIPVAILGATGTVGQKFILLLEDHPFFEITELVASSRSAGKLYREACRWKQDTPVPEHIGRLMVKSTDQKLLSLLLFSGLDSSIAGPVEEAYADQGHFVISNSKNHRMDEDVPLIIPEINHDHFEIIKTQKYKGAIITNSNCSTMFLTMALAPLYTEFGIEAVQVTTLQAISGAGYPGVPSMDILGNVIPHIGGEEEKMEIEPLKILGKLDNNRIIPADFQISAQCNRVPVFDGHTETLSIKLKDKAEVEEVKQVLREFQGLPQEMGLPFAPAQPLLVFEEEDRPQPARDIWLNRGMSTCIGRIRPCPVFDIKMVIMGHNTVRGAAGAAILNAETLLKKGYLS
ncbi:MAG TPA: aspartate-semialdehyde dehydrogenase [Spirochaetales bacterium]|nr:aspartate-semialdehyde dehydrogenase [Spirochaetales bacterium]